MGVKTRGVTASLYSRTVQIIVIIIGASATTVYGEIYQCDGKWTNKPCSGAIERTMHELAGEPADAGGEPVPEVADEPSKPRAEVLEPLAPRYALARKLKKFSKEFSQKHRISLSKEELHAFEERCTKRETPFAQCQAEHDAFVQRLTSQAQAKQKK